LKLVMLRVGPFSTEKEPPARSVCVLPSNEEILNTSTEAGTKAALFCPPPASTGMTEDRHLAFSTWKRLSNTEGPTVKPVVPGAAILHAAALGARWA
jgi:hypothetical protein